MVEIVKARSFGNENKSNDKPNDTSKGSSVGAIYEQVF